MVIDINMAQLHYHIHRFTFNEFSDLLVYCHIYRCEMIVDL